MSSKNAQAQRFLEWMREHEKNLFYGTFLFITLLLSWFLIVPEGSAFFRTRETLHTLKQKLIIHRSQFEDFDKRQAFLTRLTQRLATFNQDISSATGQVKFYEEIIHKARAASFPVQELSRTDAAISQQESLTKLALTLHAASTYPHMTQFFNALATSRSLITIESLKITPHESKPNQVIVDATLATYGK